jgi:RimJ/RimL family protein N-acetyltransferase
VDDAAPRVPPRTVLLTKRLRLEPVSVRHAEGLYRAALSSRPELLPWMPWAREITLAGNQRQTAGDERSWNAGERFPFAAIEEALVLGVIGLKRDLDRSAWLHYWIRSDRTGLGYATEAAERVLRWGIEQLGLRRVALWAGIDNRPSRRVAEKLGFADLGPMPEPMEGGQGYFLAERYERPVEPGAIVTNQVQRGHG